MERFLVEKDWSAAVKRVGRLDMSARYFQGPFRQVFDVPGDLILLRNEADGFSLLRQAEQRWHYLDRSGEPLSGEVSVEADSSVEAVVMKLPQSGDNTAGFASLKALWPELRAAWAEVGVASLFVNAGQLLLPIFALLIYDKIALNGLFETLWALVFGMALYLATDAGMRLIRSWTAERISIDLTRRSDERLWSSMVAQTDLPPGGFPRFLSNYRDLTQARDFVSSTYMLQVADIPFLLLYLGVIGIIAWQIMLVALVLVLIYAGIGLALQAQQTRLSNEAEQKNTLKLAFMGETLNCLDVVRTTPGAGTFRKSWRQISEESTDYDTQRRLAAQRTTMFATLMQTLTTVVILTAGVYLIYAQMMSIGQLIACNILAGRAMAQVASLFTVIGKRQDFMRAAERMEASLDEVEERTCTPRPDIEGHISVLGLGKHYEGRPPALENVGFTVAPGERIALLGKPGAGKSTLLRCLAGLSHPDAGQILIDGLNLADISRFDRVKWMTYKAQDPTVFAGTLEENLRIAGCRDQKRFRQALWASGLENEFKSGRMSLGMELVERGSNLSGGQRQKVALARALAQPSRILLLDEPTLGLDPESERMLAERLPQILVPSDILIMTTHSSVMLRMVERVIALDGGRVAADG
ncbi:MAG: ATP-binding cassette domain-containing protein, partial [Desulfuromonadales bacterium]|nr:ATP-binding cassette domain-containing protein [Desulfuromonadales bacterium]NIS43149.1 ATP-binding cassette domain-containing protein [Desulfuromonadales bacterium]